MRFCTYLTVLFIAFLINASPGYGQEDLKISVTASRINADPGDEITYVVKYSNAGLTPASNVVISDHLSSSGLYTYVSSSPSGRVSGNVITWDQTQIQELALLSNGEFQISVTVKAGIPGNGVTQASNGYYISASPSILDNYATITSSHTDIPVQSNLVSTRIEQNCGVLVNNTSGAIKSSTKTMVYYLMQVTNSGNVYDRYNLSFLNYDCDGPGGLGFELLSTSFSDQNGNPITKTDWIAPDQTYYFLLKLITGKGTNPGNWSCHNVVATSIIGGTTGEGKIQTKVEGSPRYPLVNLSKINTKDPVEADEIFTYTIYAFNSNDSYAAKNFVVKESYPPNITFISSIPAPDPGFNNQWTIGNLDYGLTSAQTINIKVKVNSLNNCDGNINNTVSATYEDYDASNPPSATVTTTIKSYPDLLITKSAELSSSPARKGESITYTLNYKNIGTCDAPNSQIIDLFDDVHTNVKSAGSGTQSGTQISWDLGLLVPGQEGSLTYTVLIDPESTFNSGTTYITGKSTISTSETESNYNNNTAVTSIPVSMLPDMKVEMLPVDPTIGAGTEYIYTLKISNIGDIAATDVEIKNLLPDGLKIGTPSNEGVTENNTITWPKIPTFGVGSYVEYQVKINPSCSFIPSFSSIASVTSSIIDKDETNNTETVNFVVKDDVLPVLENIPADITIGCEGIPAVGSPTATDNCDEHPVVNYLGESTTRGTNPLMPDYYNYKLTRSWDAIDASGNNSLIGTQVITIEDSAPPVAPILADITVAECSGTPTAPTTTDDCKGIITGTTSTVFPITEQGTTVVTWTFNDGNGNVITANQNVLVDDVTSPVANIASLPDAVGECSVTVTAPTATDNCKGKIIATTTDPLTYSEQGIYVIHWMYDDDNGNTSSQTQTVVVKDNTAPVADVTLLPNVVGECSVTVTAPTATDNCKGKIIGTTTDPLTYSEQGIYTIHWMYDDGNGNTLIQTQIVVVDDITSPVADIIDLPVINGECNAAATAPTATDNCKGKIIGTTTDPLTYSEQGIYTIHWMYNDGNGNTSSQTQTVIVDDVTSPVTLVLADVTVGECSGTPIAPTTTDNCKGIITGTTSTVLPITQQGTTIVTWTFDDGNGNVTTVYQNLILDDITAPVADQASLPDAVGECSVTVTAPTATDNCKGKITATTTDPLTYSDQGIYVIHWIYDDGNGNTSSQTETVVVDDVTSPVPDIASLPDAVGECSVTVTAPTATDNCKGKITATTTDPLTYSEQGIYTIHWTFDDGNGNVITASQNFLVDDVTSPVADLASLPDAVGECSVTVTAPTATDNCKGKIIGTTTDPLTYSAQGSYIIHWIYDDGNGNTLIQTQSVVVDDVTSPVADLASLPDAVGECSVTVTAPTATDNCKGKIIGTTTDPLTYSAQGSYTIHWIYDDGNGNTSSQTQTVVVDDVTPPVTPVLADVTIGECSGTPTAPTTTDDCKGEITGTTSTVFPITEQGTTVVTWTFDDGNGNVITANQNVLVDDVTAPVADITDLPVITGECSVTVTAPTATDNCKGKIIGTTTDPLTYSAQGSYTIHWIYDDGNGNTLIQTQSVVVDDITSPVADIIDLPVINGECNAAATAPTATDNCKGKIIGTTTDPLTYSEQGIYTIHWMYDDGNGNTSSQTQTVVVDDVTPPVTPVLADVTVGECSSTPIAPTTTDNCKGIITGTTSTVLPITQQGTTIVTWTFDDGNGNVVTANQNVLVDDVTPPVADLTSLPDAVGECSVTVTAPTATDNCKGKIIATTTDPLTYSEQGIYVIHWIYDDDNGNTSSQTQTVVVKDNTSPVTPVLADVTVGECSGTPTAPTTTDNCKGEITGTTSTVFPITEQGITVLTWTFDDGNGNVITANQNVLVDDVIAPVADITDLPVITGECSVTVTAPTATDNCKGKITATTTDPLTYSEQGIYTIHWTYDDGNGNTLIQTQSVVVDDVTSPVADLTSLPDAVGECSVTVTAPTATDNCKGKIIGTTTDPLTYSEQGIYTIHWIYDDGNGNTSIQTQSVVVDDITSPVKPVLAYVAVGECSGTPTAPTTTDNCKGEITGTTSTVFPITEQGTTVVTWTFDDGNGNVVTANQNVLVDDVTPPVADLASLPDAVGECSVTVTAPTATDNCKGKIIGTTTDPLTYSEQGIYTIHWIYDDGNGNTSNQMQTVVVDDVTSPVPDIASLPDAVGECSVTVTAPTATDNCKGKIIGTTTDPLTYSAQGSYIIHWMYDDGNGNVTTANQNVMVDDVTSPVADIADLPIVNGECSVTVTAPTATDNCKGKIIGTTTEPLTYSEQGIYVIHWIYDDGNGNTLIQTQSVVVDDITSPVTPVLADVTVGECSGTPTAPTTTDNCKGEITGTTSTVFPITEQGTTIVTWTFDDGNGNVTTANQNVMVDDVTSPVADIADLPIVNGECSVTVTAPTATDNCKGKIIGITTDPLTYSAQGTYTIHWMYDDGNGNTSSQMQTVVVKDITSPVTLVLADVTVGECSGTPTAPTTTDNCKGEITGTTSTVFPITEQGTTVVTWTFDDGNGNVITANQNVLVDDVTAPVADITDLPVITGECSVTVTAPTATDNCKGKISATTTDPFTYSAQGTYTIHWIYDDGNGNTSSQTQTVVVDDVTSPVTPVLADVTVGECSGTPTAPTTTDDCKGEITGTTSTVFPITEQGTTVVTWTFDDGNGNVTTANQNVLVDDVTPPVTPVIADVFLGECSGTPPIPTTMDNCKGLISGTTSILFPKTKQGKHTIIWTFDDGNGNVTTAYQNLILDDITAPVADITDLPIVNGECSVTVTAPTATDNCKGKITATTTDPLTYSEQGIYIIHWIYDDGNGNTLIQTQSVVVDDVTSPVADLTSLPDAVGECSVTVTAPTATDNCKGKIIGTTTDPLTYSEQGIYTIHWIYDDGNGNTSIQTQSVVVDDITSPVKPVLADVAVGECSGTPTAPTTTDDCKGEITGTTSTVFPITKQGTTVVTWTFDDGNGNVITANQNVLVDDVTPPVADLASLPDAVGECSVTVTAPTATDNCKGKIIATTTDPLTYSEQGTYTIHWIYDDGNGNTLIQTQSVAVDDITSPVTPVLADITVGECSGTPIAPITTDNCKGIITGTTSTVFPITEQGTTVVTWTFDDGNGNVTTASQNVLVDDVTSPVADIASLPDAVGECSVTVTAPTATDNCKGKIIATTTDPLTYSEQGTYTIHWIYDDGNGNTLIQTQSVVVDDITSPVTPVLADITVGECSGIPIAPITTDNCKGIITGTTSTVFPITEQGTTVVTWTFDDGNGNVTTASQNVLVDDVTSPVADIASLPNALGECSVTVTAPTATDNCKGKIIATTTDPLTYSEQGIYTIHWVYDDGNGNTSSQMQTVVVKDITSPVTPVLADITVGECSGTPIAPTTTDNCKGEITGTTSTVFPITEQGTTVVTWTFDDGNGNVTTASQNVLVDDVTSPVADIASLPDAIGECSVTVTAPTAIDNCKGKIIATTTDPLTYSEKGIYSIHWIYDDGNGNTSSQTKTVVVDDVTSPVPDIASLPDAVGECSVTVTAPTATDNCKGKIQATTTDPLTYSAQGIYTIHWMYDDGNGNTSSQTQTVVVNDVTPPVTPVLADVFLGECSGTPPIPTTMDNCKGLISGTTSILFPKTKQGKHTIIWTFDDGNGNVTTAYQNLILDDVTAPVADIANLPEINGECSVTVTAPTATDNCKGKITATTTDPLTYSSQGSYVIHWVYDDGNGNISTQTQNVNVNAITPVTPVLADVNVGQCSGTPTAPSINNTCSGIITGTTTTAFPITTQGTTVVTWTFDDGKGNVITAKQNVIVDDITPPVPVLASLQEITTECRVTLISPTATDNCNGKITATTTDPLTYSVQGSYIVHWIYDDGNGNSSTQTQNVLVKDITPPEITGTIAPITVDGCSVEEVAPAVNTVSALEAIGLSIQDGCTVDALLTVTSKDVSSGEIPVTVTRTYTIKDASNNSTDYVQKIVVTDSQKPTILCPPDLNVTADAGNCNVTNLLLGVPITNDNCSISSVSNDAPSIFGLGTTVVTWTVSDKSGNTATCQQNVNVDGSPVAIDDKIDLNSNSQIAGNVMTNDLGLCDTSIQMYIVSEPQFGSLTSATNGNFEYIPQNTYSGRDMFTYQICDKDGDCSTATVEITINSLNDLPLSVADTENLQVDVTLNGNVAANDRLSGDGDNVWALVSLPSNGTINFNPDGTYTYVPKSGFIGNDNFIYELCDANGDCSKAQVTIVVKDVLIPNQILTPNGDNHNDTFIIKGIEYYPTNKVTIYNRWGNIVYKMNNYQNEWDGYSNVSKVGSNSLPMGTYYYLIDYANNRHKTGFVYLDK